MDFINGLLAPLFDKFKSKNPTVAGLITTIVVAIVFIIQLGIPALVGITVPLEVVKYSLIAFAFLHGSRTYDPSFGNSWFRDLFDAFKAKSPAVAGYILTALGLIYYLSDSNLLNFLPPFALSAVKIISLLWGALQGSETYQYLKKDEQL